jgi:rare lipoprotein A
VRRTSFVICTLVLLSACGHKQVRVSAPPTALPTAPLILPPSSDLEGLATYYAEPYDGRKTASGEIFNSYRELTAAHRTLPFNTMVRVTNQNNGLKVDVRINDRGPFVDGRVIDLSARAARQIDLIRSGVAPVKLEILKPADTPKSVAAFAVQVGAFENSQSAQDLKRHLERKYLGVVIETVSAEKTLYRVCIGEFDMTEANKVAAELRKDDFKPFVVRLN